ncbi:sodium-coupled monocarboxylate transporter 1-like [Crassostrea virginica]|uniref:Sodium-coupled monocarboxylate transporter 1-like n=1 Tax=Crassostrea virginica TaxID=6565 RepID=A0A8B8C4G7_CRAVI|nr:sodium-coupled monocarboxylate transporter 1-like [Crassostrea virginica]
MVENKFQLADYIIFGVMLLISVGIGVFYACAGGKQQTNREFLMADRSMRSLPVALSVLASFFSASTLLGTPAEIYEYGIQYWISVFGAILAPLTGAFFFGPMFFNLKLVSVYEYLELRFHSKSIRLFSAALFILRLIMGMGIVLYGPSTALAAVTGFPVWAIILVVGGVCTFYTTLGGMKAVIWTDVFQTFVMFAGMLAVFIQGCIKVGGLDEMWNINYEGGRINFFDFDPDPRVRQTFWSLTVGIYFVWLYPYTVDQQMVQRFSSARSLSDARFALICNVPGMFLLITLCSLTGLALYANYVTCDPLKNGDVANANQLLPFFVMEVFEGLPGLPGLFVACMISGALSSISSMLNSLAAVTWEDFLKLKFSALSERSATKVTRTVAFLYGLLGIGMAFAVKEMGGTVLQASLAFNGSAGAPLVGVFILGACFTSSNWLGALIGGLLGFAFSMWGLIGKYVSLSLNFRLPTSTLGCNSNTTTAHDVITSTDYQFKQTDISLEGLDQFYGISYLWFSALGVIITVCVGLLVSWCSRGQTERTGKVPDNLKLKMWENICMGLCFPPNLLEKEKQQKELRDQLKDVPSIVYTHKQYRSSILVMQPLDFSLDVNDFPQQTSDFETTTETKVQEDHDSSGADQTLKKQ